MPLFDKGWFDFKVKTAVKKLNFQMGIIRDCRPRMIMISVGEKRKGSNWQKERTDLGRNEHYRFWDFVLCEYTIYNFGKVT